MKEFPCLSGWLAKHQSARRRLERPRRSRSPERRNCQSNGLAWKFRFRHSARGGLHLHWSLRWLIIAIGVKNAFREWDPPVGQTHLNLGSLRAVGEGADRDTRGACAPRHPMAADLEVGVLVSLVYTRLDAFALDPPGTKNGNLLYTQRHR